MRCGFCAVGGRYAIEPMQQSAWAQGQLFVPDGIATVAPGANALSDLFDAVGIGASWALEG